MTEDTPIERLRRRIDALEQDMHDLKLVFDTINHDLRADMYSTMVPIGVDQNEFRHELRTLAALLQDISVRMGKLEVWASMQDMERHARQQYIDAKQQAIDAKLDEIMRRR